jgi:hypothetical protein
VSSEPEIPPGLQARSNSVRDRLAKSRAPLDISDYNRTWRL